jgi:hypothetical protein
LKKKNKLSNDQISVKVINRIVFSLRLTPFWEG